MPGPELSFSPVCGFSMKEQVGLNAVWTIQNRLALSWIPYRLRRRTKIMAIAQASTHIDNRQMAYAKLPHSKADGETTDHESRTALF